MSRLPREILIRPVITEESSRLQFNPGRIRKRHQDKEGEIQPQFVFEVSRDATKVEIRKAVEALFDGRVKTGRTMNVQGKKRRMGRSLGRRPHWKKAVVELAEGELIEAIGGL